MSEHRWRVDCVVGTRPNFVKAAPIARVFNERSEFSFRLLHTGQHYDKKMSDVFFEELQIPAPAVNFEVGPGTAVEHTARIMLFLEKVINASRPDLLIVIGDVNSTMAASLVAAQLSVPIAHVEAGLRSGDRTMPEEINRIVIDRLSDLLLITEESADINLRKEGISSDKICLVGNVMIDSLHFAMDRAVPAYNTLADYGLHIRKGDQFGLVTLHRPSNVDDPTKLAETLKALASLSAHIPLFFPAHPRTLAIIEKHGLNNLTRQSKLILAPPISYFRLVGLMKAARLVITDSGGMQEETTALGVPCLTFRDNTERPVTISAGSNRLIGTNPEAIQIAALEELNRRALLRDAPAYWDGMAAPRILSSIEKYLATRT